MKKTLLTFGILLLFFIFNPAAVLTEGSLGTATGNLGRAGSQAGADDVANLSDIVGRTIGIALSIVGLVFLVLMVYAGYLWMIARGEEEKAKKAQKIIIDCLIGLVIVVGAYAITFLVMDKFK